MNQIKYIFKTTISTLRTKEGFDHFFKYWLGGSIYFWSGYIIFAVGYGFLHWYWLLAKIIADGISWTLNYFIQRHWVFSHQSHFTEKKHIKRYILIESIGFIIDYLIIWGLKTIGITPYIGYFISAGFFTVWSYLWYQYWVFPVKKETL